MKFHEIITFILLPFTILNELQKRAEEMDSAKQKSHLKAFLAEFWLRAGLLLASFASVGH